MAEEKDQTKEVQDIYAHFELGTSYKNTLDLNKEIERSVLFEGGKQWNMDADIEDFPKITLNIIKQIGKTRKSNIMQNKYAYLINSTNFPSIRKIQDFMKYLAEMSNMRMKDLKALGDDYTISAVGGRTLLDIIPFGGAFPDQVEAIFFFQD